MPRNAPPKTHTNTIADINSDSQLIPLVVHATDLARHSKRSLTNNHEVAVLVTSNKNASPGSRTSGAPTCGSIAAEAVIHARSYFVDV